MASALKQKITEDMKTAMKAQDKERLGTIRLILAALKQREVDERIELDDSQVLAILNTMLKQRRASIEQFAAANRDDLVAIEESEVKVIQAYMPEQLTETELAKLIEEALASTGATKVADMGKVMNHLRPQVQGRTDMAQVSALIKIKLC